MAINNGKAVQMKNGNGEKIYPLTSMELVYDSEGNNLSQRLDRLPDEIQVMSDSEITKIISDIVGSV